VTGRRLVGVAIVTVAALCAASLAGCGLSDLTLPGGAPSGPSFQVTADFTDVLDLVPQAAVKVNDVTVGSVQSISLSGWTARVRMRVERGVALPANASASIRQTSLLGEKFVALSAPVGQPAEGTLADGAQIPASRTSRTAEVEEVLSALGLLLGGGGLAQLKTINEELTNALQGRESTVQDLLKQLNTFLAGLDAQKSDITRAIDALDRFSAHLADQKATIGKAIDALDPGLTVLAQQRVQLTDALTALSSLSTVGTRVVNGSRDATLANLAALRPILDQLSRAGDNLPKALNFLLTYPFPPNVAGAISGDFVNLHATIDLNGATILSNLLAAAPPAPAAPAKPGAPASPTLPGGILPQLPLPQLPGAPPAGVPPVTGGGSQCGLLGLLTGCGQP
jgi:phospholipid/cholesterol/gamma-HCH transport system substrate-binding protein